MTILLQLQKLAKEYSGEKIFSNLSFSVTNKQKIGIVGRNGAGKSTLFRILSGEEVADGGEIIINEKTKIAYLKQYNDWQAVETALEYLIRISDQEDWRVRQLASKFELREEKLQLLANSLSGGWRMRLKICAMLLQDPNLLLLDEPTNYLDLNTILLLENYLRSYNKSFLIISHDRNFLQKTCHETIEISKTGCYHYTGSIDAYLDFKAQKLATLIKANESLERQQEHWQEFIDRFRYKASKAKQAQAMIRKISKLEEKRIKIEDDTGIQRINVAAVQPRNNFILKIRNMTIGYQEKKVVENIQLDLKAGEKLAILGLNGLGKSTLIKTLNKDINPLSGSFTWSTNLKIVCHSQEEMEKMDAHEQAGSYLRRMATSDIKTETVLKMAGDFLFIDEELKKNIGILSGGEKSRLLLAGLLLSKPDVLLLDEVTCHLDFETRDALAIALKKYQGSIIFASHDRGFCEAITNSILELENGGAKIIYEDYSDYLKRLEKRILQGQLDNHAVSDKSKKLKEKSRQDYYGYRAKQKKIQSLEKELEKMHVYKKNLLNYFLENYQKYNKEKNEELEMITRRIADKEEYWLMLQAELETGK